MGTKIKINSAAETDISNLQSAHEKLESSRSSIERLKNISSAMQGASGVAITEQCTKLDEKIKDLQENITSSQKEIRKAVEWYRERDRLLAAKMGGR